MVKSKTKIDKQLEKKTNSSLVETILIAKKKENWVEVAGMLSCPRRKRKDINLGELNVFAKEGEKIVVAGKVLSQGEIEKKINVVALGFSERAKEKLLEKGCKVSEIIEEIKSNPDAKEIKILK